jgi:hypothetical protein
VQEDELDLVQILPTITLYKTLAKGKPLEKKPSIEKAQQLLGSSREGSPEYYELIAILISHDASAMSIRLTSTFKKRDDQIVKEIASRIEWYIDYDDLLKLAVNWDSPLVREVAKYLTLNHANDSRVYLPGVLPQIQKIAESVAVDPQVLFLIFDGYSDQLEGGLTIENLQKIIPDLETYDIAFTVKSDISTHIRKTAKKFLENMDNESWSEVFGDETSYKFQLLLKSLSTGVLKTLPQSALDSYKESLTTISQDYNTTENQDPWTFLYGKSNKPSLVPTIKNVRDHFLNTGEISPTQFLIFERPLRELGKLEERAGDFVRRVLTKVYDDDECLTRIVQNTEFYVSTIVTAGNDAIDLINAISQWEFEKDTDPQILEFQNKVAALMSKDELVEDDEEKAAS